MAALLAGLPIAPLAASKPTPAGLSTYVEARTADALGDERRAARLYATLAAADPTNRGLARRVVGAAIDAGEMDLALSVARAMPAKALALDGRLLLVADLVRRGRSNDALALIDGAGDRDGGFIAPLVRAWALHASGRDGDATLAAVGGDTLLSPFLVEQRAALLLAAGRVDEAMMLVPQALAAAGGRETRLRLAYAAMLAKAGARDKAQVLLVDDDPTLRRLDLDRPQAGIAIDTPATGFAELLLALAVSLAQGNDRALPLTLVQVAQHAAPDSSEAAILRGLFLDRRGRDSDALAAFASVPANDPFIDDALDGRARLLLKAKRGPEALAAAERAVSRSSALAGDHGRLGNVLDELGRHAEAAEAYSRASALADRAASPDRWTWRLLRAAQLDELDRWPEAKAELMAGLAAAPDQPLLLNYLGYGSLERGENLDEAEAMIRRALALRPDDASITDSLGWALYKRGRLPEAIDTLRKAAAADPAQAEIHEHLGDALYRAGRRFEARFAWQAALLHAEDDSSARLEAKIASGWTEAAAAP